MKRRWPLVLLGSLVLLISTALLATLFSARSRRGAVPGKAPLLGLAVAQGRYLAGSETGLFVSADGATWSRPERFSGKPVLVTGLEGRMAAILSDEQLSLWSPAGEFAPSVTGSIKGTALASSGGSVYVAEAARRLRVFSRDCLIRVSPQPACDETSLITTEHIRRGPDEIIALDVVPSDPPTVFAGGLRAGVWRSTDPGHEWKKVLGTASRAIMVDDGNPRRIFLATAGGILLSTDQGLSWDFSGMREPVEALAQFDERYVALGGDRLLYESSDGRIWSARSPD